jgi:serine/threonine protein kinase/tetratricopeptide (TPR) repeat protein/TolB-like protein
MRGRILGHYRLIELVGAGGMGEVYRARDERLERDVAVKVLPEAVAADPERLGRFEREAKALARLEHPNILTIHDFGIDTEARPEAPAGQRPAEAGRRDVNGHATAYAVTELLSGETLRARLGREQLSWRRAVEIAAAVADGLGAAHEQGIVHRDIKPENLFLIANGRVKILDFGLATSGPAAETSVTRGAGVADTAVGAVVGTIGYMAPEQVQGTGADARSDIFALGCVLYEMVSGQRAFARPTATETLAAILATPAPELSVSGSDAPAELGRITARCLEKQPGQRFQSATDLAFALRALTTAPGAAADGAARASSPGVAQASRLASTTSSTRWFAIGAAAFVLAVLAAAAWWWPRRAADPSPASALDLQKVVVAVFVNRTGDPTLDALGIQAADWLTQNLTRISANIAVNPELPSMGGLGMPPSVLAKGANAIRALADRTGARFVVTGAYYLEGDQLRVQSQFMDAEKGTVAVSLNPVVGPRSTPAKVIGDLTSRVMGALAVRLDRVWTVESYRPPSYEAYLEYLRALAAFGQNYPEAERHLRRSFELDATFYRARMYLWALYANQGRLAEAEAVTRANEEPLTFSQLTPAEQASTRFGRARLDGNLRAELAATAEWARLAPGIESYYMLGTAYAKVHQPRAALDALSRIAVDEQLGHLGPGGTWHYNLRLSVLHELGEYTKQLEAARLGQKVYPADGAFLSQEAGALIALGRIGEVEGVIGRCQSATLRSGSVGAMLYRASRELAVHGRADAAKAMAGRAAVWYKERLELAKPTPALRSSLANALLQAGDCEQGLALRRDLAHELPDNLSYQSSYATTLVACAGSREEARKIAERLDKLERPFLLGEHLYERARILAALGDGDGAVRALQAAFDQGKGWDAAEMHLDRCWDPIRSHPGLVEWMKPKG